MLNVRLNVTVYCVYSFVFFLLYCDYFVIELALVHEFRMQHKHNHNIFVFIGLV